MIGVIERFVCYVFLRCCEGESDGAKDKLCHIEDVFLNENKAREFTQKCNDFQLLPVHIYDAVLDAIG